MPYQDAAHLTWAEVLEDALEAAGLRAGCRRYRIECLLYDT
jgi:hypothetical protein